MESAPSKRTFREMDDEALAPIDGAAPPVLAVLTLPGPLVVRLHNYSGLDDANSVTDFDVVLTLLEDIVKEAMCDGKVHCMRSMRAASRCRPAQPAMPSGTLSARSRVPSSRM